ncbi:MAG TPA: PBP1A family penicillin-binding protein [Gammaproteobacteria bacterium]|nr:PBP1A family penicillin-binding protein [Gammaproteobacteria bacterium]
MIALAALGAMVAVAASVWVYRVVLPGLPTAAQIRDMHMQEPLRVYAAGGGLIAEYGTKQRIPIPYERIPARVREAFLAAEDANFFHEPGVSWEGLLRAAIHLVLTGRKDQGGSTITMQVARNFFLTARKTYARKAREILVAIRMHQLLTKQQILALYLNKIYLGQGAYGIEAAARVYYGKDLMQLTLPEIAMLAGLPQAPSEINPITNPTAALHRRAYVLGRMRDLDDISEAEYQAASAAPITATLHSFAPQVDAAYVGAMVRDAVYQRYGSAALTDGYRVYTTINARLQAAANHALRWDLLRYTTEHGYRGPEAHLNAAELSPAAMDKALQRLSTIAGLVPGVVSGVGVNSIQVYLGAGKQVTVGWSGLSWARPYVDQDHTGPVPANAAQIAKLGDVVRIQHLANGSWRLAQIPKVQGALVSIAPRDGAIRALVGGFSFRLSHFNRVTQAYRQPGSSFKPFVYSAALAKGFTAATMINDAPVVLPAGQGFDWRPEDYEKTFLGPVLLQTGLIDSLNLVSIRILQDIGVDYARQYAARFGFDPARIPDNLTLVLGSGSISPLESARAYSVFANGGFRIKPWFINRIVDQQGNVVFQSDPEVACPDCPVSEPPQPAAAGAGAAALPASAEDATVSDATVSDATASDATAAAAAPPAAPRPAPRAISAQNDYLMVQMLHRVIQHGTGQAARALGRNDLAGKTGTTNRQRDAWFAGFNPALVTVSWVGFDHVTPLGHAETGARAALPMWMSFMRAALKGQPERFLPQPPGLVTVRINSRTGQPAGIDDPGAVFITFRGRYAPTVKGQGGPPPPPVPHLF